MRCRPGEPLISFVSFGSTRAMVTFTRTGNAMENEYDFSNPGRGKFHRKDAALELPIYLDPKVREYLAAHAKARGMELDQLVNELLTRDIDLIKAAK